MKYSKLNILVISDIHQSQTGKDILDTWFKNRKEKFI